MPSPDPLQRLRPLDQSSPRFPNELTNLLHDQGYKDCLKDLRDEDSIFCPPRRRLPPPGFHILPSHPHPLPGYTTSLLSLPSFLPSTMHIADRVQTSAIHFTSPPCVISSWQSDNATPAVPHHFPTRNDLERSRNARAQARDHTKRIAYVKRVPHSPFDPFLICIRPDTLPSPLARATSNKSRRSPTVALRIQTFRWPVSRKPRRHWVSACSTSSTFDRHVHSGSTAPNYLPGPRSIHPCRSPCASMQMFNQPCLLRR